MDRYMWLKSMAHYPSMRFYYPINPQVLLYDGYIINFYDRELNIIWSNHILYFILQEGDYLYYQNNNNVPNLKIKNL